MAKITRGWRVSSWANDINPVNWKIVVVAYMQMALMYAFSLGYLCDLLMQVWHGKDVDYHVEALWAVCSFLAALSGISFGGRLGDRVTDYGYVERKNAGKVAGAAAPQQVNTGDNTTLNIAPAPVAADTTTPAAPPAVASIIAQPVPSDDDQGLG